MLSVTPTHVRIITAAALFATLLFGWLNGFDVISYDEQIANARMWNYFDARLPHWALAIYWLLNLINAVLGLVGLFWFWRPARWMLVVTILGSLLMQPFFGLLVFSATERTLSTIIGVLFSWLVVVCFWTPIADRFRRSKSEGVA